MSANLLNKILAIIRIWSEINISKVLYGFG